MNDAETNRKLWSHRRKLVGSIFKELEKGLEYVKALKNPHMGSIVELNGQNRNAILVNLRCIVLATRWLLVT